MPSALIKWRRLVTGRAIQIRDEGGSALEPIELARRIVYVIEDKLGEDIVLLDLSDVSLFTDFFVICNGTSERQVRALAEGVREVTKQEFGLLPHHVEGEPFSGWVLLDYLDVVVHIFSPELRAFYDLEGLWNEAKVLVRMQ